MQRAQNFVSRRRAPRMQHTTAPVPAFASKNKFRAAAVEVHAPGDDFLDPMRRFLDQNLHRVEMAQAITGVQRVLQVQTDFVLVA